MEHLVQVILTSLFRRRDSDIASEFEPSQIECGRLFSLSPRPPVRLVPIVIITVLIIIIPHTTFTLRRGTDNLPITASSSRPSHLTVLNSPSAQLFTMYSVRLGMIRSSLVHARRFSTTRPAQAKVAVLGAAGTCPLHPLKLDHLPNAFDL